MKKTAAAGGAAGGALDPSPPELRARYDSLTKKYRFLKKEYVKLLKDWEETGQKYLAMSRERKYLRAKLSQLLRTTKVSERTSVLMAGVDMPVATHRSAEDEEDQEVSESGAETPPDEEEDDKQI